MKQLLFLLTALLLTLGVSAKQQETDFSKKNPSKKTEIVEVSCGECKFKMKGAGCHMAIRMKGKSYFVDNASVDAFGDAHSKKGFCKAIRKAEVQGEILKSNRYQLSYFKFIK